jgi:hypothetical protein
MAQYYQSRAWMDGGMFDVAVDGNGLKPFGTDAPLVGNLRGGIETVRHLHLLAHLGESLGGEVEGSDPALDEYGNLILRRQVLAVGAMLVGPATSALSFDKGSRK